MPVLQMGPRCDERQQLESGYIARDLDLENERIKQVQRDRVMRFIRQHHPDQKMRLFSLPGAWWTFENQLIAEYPDAHFVAVERNYTVLQHGVPFMPGTNRHRFAEHITSGVIEGYESTQASILWLRGGDMVQLHREELASLKNRWKLRYKKWTAAWWDFQSPVNNETVGCLLGTERHLNGGRDKVPVSVTLMLGRETAENTHLLRTVSPEAENALHRRADFMTQWVNHHNRYRTMEVVEAFSYLSAAGCPMLLVNTLFHLRKGAPQ